MAYDLDPEIYQQVQANSYEIEQLLLQLQYVAPETTSQPNPVETNMASPPAPPVSAPQRQKHTSEEERERPRLTEEEKKANHIASEQKRRQAIREGFDRLTEIVPGLEGQARSEGIVLHGTVGYIKQLLRERRAMIQVLERNGLTVDSAFKMVLELLPDGWLDEADNSSLLKESKKDQGQGKGPHPKCQQQQQVLQAPQQRRPVQQQQQQQQQQAREKQQQQQQQQQHSSSSSSATASPSLPQQQPTPPTPPDNDRVGGLALVAAAVATVEQEQAGAAPAMFLQKSRDGGGDGVVHAMNGHNTGFPTNQGPAMFNGSGNMYMNQTDGRLG